MGIETLKFPRIREMIQYSEIGSLLHWGVHGADSPTNTRSNTRSLAGAALPGKEAETDADEPNAETTTPSAQASPMPTDDGKMLSDIANEELDRHLGLVAQVVGEEFNTRFSRGDFGPLLIDVDQPEPEPSSPVPLLGLQGNLTNPTETAREAKKTALPTSSDSLRMWNPGIVYLGNAVTKEILEKAKSENIDIVIHFEVVLKAGRGDTIQNASRVRLINVSTGKSIGVSKTIDSNEESQLASKGTGGREYVSEQLENLLTILDRDIKVVEMPKLTPTVARRRLAMLLGSEPERSLRTLAEIRLYQKQQLLTPEEVETAFDIVGGSESLLLLYGTAVERVAMVRQLAAKPPEKSKS